MLYFCQKEKKLEDALKFNLVIVSQILCDEWFYCRTQSLHDLLMKQLSLEASFWKSRKGVLNYILAIKKDMYWSLEGEEIKSPISSSNL